jgi:hypothetical protein
LPSNRASFNIAVLANLRFATGNGPSKRASSMCTLGTWRRAIDEQSRIPGMAGRVLASNDPALSIGDHVLSVMRSIGRAVAADHALAQRAAVEAALPCRNLAEVRAMCVSPLTVQRQDDERDLTPDATPHAPAAKRIQGDRPSWSSPFPKQR